MLNWLAPQARAAQEPIPVPEGRRFGPSVGWGLQCRAAVLFVSLVLLGAGCVTQDEPPVRRTKPAVAEAFTIELNRAAQTAPSRPDAAKGVDSSAVGSPPSPLPRSHREFLDFVALERTAKPREVILAYERFAASDLVPVDLAASARLRIAVLQARQGEGCLEALASVRGRKFRYEQVWTEQHGLWRVAPVAEASQEVFVGRYRTTVSYLLVDGLARLVGGSGLARFVVAFALLLGVLRLFQAPLLLRAAWPVPSPSERKVRLLLYVAFLVSEGISMGWLIYSNTLWEYRFGLDYALGAGERAGSFARLVRMVPGWGVTATYGTFLVMAWNALVVQVSEDFFSPPSEFLAIVIVCIVFWCAIAFAVSLGVYGVLAVEPTRPELLSAGEVISILATGGSGLLLLVVVAVTLSLVRSRLARKEAPGAG